MQFFELSNFSVTPKSLTGVTDSSLAEVSFVLNPNDAQNKKSIIANTFLTIPVTDTGNTAGNTGSSTNNGTTNTPTTTTGGTTTKASDSDKFDLDDLWSLIKGLWWLYIAMGAFLSLLLCVICIYCVRRERLKDNYLD